MSIDVRAYVFIGENKWMILFFVLEPDFEKFLVQYRRQQEGKQVLYSCLPYDAGEVFDYNEYKKQGKHFLDANNALIDPSLRSSDFKFRNNYVAQENLS